MGFLVAVCILALAAFVVVVVSRPLRRSPLDATASGAPEAGGAGSDPLAPARDLRLAELRSAREAKYREIRDAELDFRTGKLSREDYEAIDGELRAEALEILAALEALEDGEDRTRTPRGG